ncbi:MAG: diguanylate cyclase [Clostridiaceae bacterium]|nr:diguanylate cyclase [Clostridiaceae bacterium]
MTETTQAIALSRIMNADTLAEVVNIREPMLYGFAFVVLMVQVIFIVLPYKVVMNRSKTVNNAGDYQKESADEIMQKQKLSYEALFKNSTDAIIQFNQNCMIIDINEKVTDLFGYTIDDIYGKDIDSVMAPREKYDEGCGLTKAVLSGNIAVMEDTVRIGSDEKPREVSVKGVAIILNDKIIGGYGIYSDISQRKKAEREIIYMNYHDQLTGLYNRRFFEEELKRLDTERNLPISLIMADVNGLKLYNDAFGHIEGDKLLVKAAEVIRKELRESEIVARWGGDEIVILLPGIDLSEANRIVERIKTSISNIRMKDMELSISFGCDTKSSAGQNINDIQKNAENYMYRNKLVESPGVKGKTINAIIDSLYRNSYEEEKHSMAVGSLCESIGAAMGMGRIEMCGLRTLGLLHDIGKFAIDNSILNKQGRLSKEELNEIKRHPEIGYRILSSANDMAELAEFVLAHHERWDGKGYPKGLKGEEIPLQARIAAVAEAYDAMTGERAYRKALSEKKAVEELEKNSGTQFDPEIVQVFIEKVLKE